MRLLAALILGALALGLAACGGSDERASDEEKLEEALATLEEELERNPIGPGLGEASPPATGEWRTDFSKRLVPLEEFEPGGPTKDGIPALDEPRFTPASEVDWLNDREPVIELAVDGETRAYPIQVLVWHEIVNDTVGTTPVAVTFCPLCNTAIVFDRRLEGRTYSFGTTGKLRESDLVMYDRETESWWQQFSGEALVGALAGTKLGQLPGRMVAWEDFRRAHPESLVLNRETGFVRDYGRNPYAGYDRVDAPPIFATRGDDDDRLPPKERVVYVEVGERAYAVPFSSLARRGRMAFASADGEVVVRWESGVASALDASGLASGRDVGAATVMLGGRPIPFTEPFWFVVAAFRPDLELVEE